MPLKPKLQTKDHFSPHVYNWLKGKFNEFKPPIDIDEFKLEWQWLGLKVFNTFDDLARHATAKKWCYFFNIKGIQCFCHVNKDEYIGYSFVGSNGEVNFKVGSDKKVWIESSVEGEAGITYVENMEQLVRVLAEKLAMNIRFTFSERVMSCFLARDAAGWYCSNTPFSEWI